MSSGRLAPHEPDELVDGQRVRLAVGEQELAARAAVRRGLEIGPRRLRRLVGRRRLHARAHVDRRGGRAGARSRTRSPPCRSSRRAGAAATRGRRAPRSRPPAGSRRRRPHAQRVEVVGDRRLVAVLGEDSGSRSASAVASGPAGAAGPPKYRWAMSASTCASSRWTASSVPASAPSGSAVRGAEVEVGHQPADAQDGRRAAVAGVGGGQRVRAAPRPRTPPSPGSRARRAGSARPGRRSAARAPRAGRPGSRRPPAAARAPGRRGRAPRPLAAGGSATRSIRRTMSPASIAAPACRNAWASSRSIVRLVTPQNIPQRSRTYA